MGAYGIVVLGHFSDGRVVISMLQCVINWVVANTVSVCH